VNQLAKPLGFFDGVKAVLSGVSYLGKNPGTWPMAAVPAVLLLLLTGFGVFAGVAWLRPELVALLGLDLAQSGWAILGGLLAEVLISLATAAAAVWVALVLTPPLSAPALEHLVTLREGDLGVPKRGPSSFLGELRCGLRAQLFAAVFATPILALLWVVNLLFPPAAVVTVPLNLLVLALGVAWSVFDYPLTLRRVSAGDRLSLVLEHRAPVLGFGLTLAALFWVPCCSVLMLPVGAVGATTLLWRLLENSPHTLPALPRPTAAVFVALDAPARPAFAQDLNER
jgi:CysZ protein